MRPYANDTIFFITSDSTLENPTDQNGLWHVALDPFVAAKQRIFNH